MNTPETPTIPYKIACLCELRDPDNRVLLLHRRRHPNRDLYSPIGGKLEQHTGESPTACALREIHEEVGLQLTHDQLHLLGIVSERAYAAADDDRPTHWLMFWFRVLTPIDPDTVPKDFDEGTLDWVPEADIHALPLPATDRNHIWPAVLKHSDNTRPANPRLGFFALHLDCAAPGDPVATLEQTVLPAHPTPAPPSHPA